jgi:hypothetical protein
LTIAGEQYEYMGLDEEKVRKLVKFIEVIPEKEKVEFIDLTRIKIDSVR